MLALVPAGLTTAVWFKILIYGNSGAGKTWRACQARKPGDRRKVLGLLTEANGVQSARHANPDILLPSWPLTERRTSEDGTVEEVPMLDADGNQMVRHYAVTMDEVRDVLRMVINREVPDLDTLVVDGLTEIQAMMKDEIQRFKDRLAAEKKKPELATFSKGDWGELTEKMRRLMRSLRDLPLNVVSTALADVETEEDGDSTIRYTMPSFQGRKLHNQAAAFQNVVAYAYTASKRDDKGKRKIERFAMVEGPETIQCKPAHPLTGVLEEPLWEWLDLLANPPEEAVGRELTDEDRAALEAAQGEGAEQTEQRRKKEGGEGALPEPGDGKKEGARTRKKKEEGGEAPGEGEEQGSSGKVTRGGRVKRGQ